MPNSTIGEKINEFNEALEIFYTDPTNLYFIDLLNTNPSLYDLLKKVVVEYTLEYEFKKLDLLLEKLESSDPIFKFEFENKYCFKDLSGTILTHSVVACNPESLALIDKHISKFKLGKDHEGDNLLSLLMEGDSNQEGDASKDHATKFCIEISKILIKNGVSVDDINSDGKTPLDLCYNFEIFKTLAQYASPETLEKKLLHIIEREHLYDDDGDNPDLIDIFKFLLIEKKVKIDLNHIFHPNEFMSFFYDMVKDHCNEEQKKICDKMDKCKKAIESFLSPTSSDEKNIEYLDFVLNFIPNELLNPEVLEKIITKYPKFLERKNNDGLGLVFYAINHNLDALEKIIRFGPKEILNQKNKYGLTPVFYAFNYNLDALEKIIRFGPKEILNQENKDGLTPVFYAIITGNMYILNKIICAKKETLEQQNLNGENPILLSLRIYSNLPSENNKKILKFIFKIQFDRELRDKEIKNLVEFVDSYNFLKLFYNHTGQSMYDYNFKSILPAVLPEEGKLEDELSKKLLEIYKKIAEARRKPSLIIHNDDEMDLHIYQSKLKNHFSYFIFDVNSQNKLTKISYCDGNITFPRQEIIRHDGTPSNYIHGVTTFELTQPQDFNQKFAEDFIKKNSKNRENNEFYQKEFSPEKLASKEIFGIKFSAITHLTPTKIQTRGNCSLKSSNILARFLLEHQEKKELFTYDEISGVQGGEGYRPYKDLRQKMVDKAVDNISKILEQLPKEFITKLKIYKKILPLYSRSSYKVNKKRGETTKFTPPLHLLDKISRELFLKAREKITEGNASITSTLRDRNFVDFSYKVIASSHFNLIDQDTEMITTISKEVKIDKFLAWDFETLQAKNNFVRFFVFEDGDEAKKRSFKSQLIASDPQSRSKFFEDLSQENISLILSTFEIEKIKLKKLQHTKEQLQTKIANMSDMHRIEGFKSDPTTFDMNAWLDKMKINSSPSILNGFINRFFLEYKTEDKEKYLNSCNIENLSFILSHYEKIFKKLENSIKIITELERYNQDTKNKTSNEEVKIKAIPEASNEEVKIKAIPEASNEEVKIKAIPEASNEEVKIKAIPEASNEEVKIKADKDTEIEIKEEAPSSRVSCLKPSCITAILARIKKLKF